MIGNMFLHWLLYHCGMHGARTQTTQSERELLRTLAQGKTCVVELGVYEGVTTLAIRRVISPDGKIWGVDPFLSGRLGLSYGYTIASSEVNKSKNGEVEFTRMLSQDAVKGWNQSIDLIFMDADHTYDAVKQDWSMWSPHIRSGGYAAFHDSRLVQGRSLTTHDGPVMLVKEIIEKQSKTYKLTNEIDSLTVFQKVQ